MTTNKIDQIIREYKEYQALEEQLKEQLETLKKQAIEYLTEAGTDEYTCDDGKITYREVLSKRFASTEFKKLHKDLYDAFTAQTSSMRFTCN